jgi:glycosyltransferase involved in cell wall biosynthesis
MGSTIRVLLLSRYGTLGASSRYRSYQYLSRLRTLGFHVTVSPLLDNEYVRAIYQGRAVSAVRILGSYLRRFLQLLRSQSFEVIWIEKEALPWIPWALESLLHRSGVPYVVDYDDATFHRYDAHVNGLVRAVLGRKIDAIMRNAAQVMVGNEYLAERARQAGAQRVEIIPTVIDLDRYPDRPALETNQFVIGWIGTPITAGYLRNIQEALRRLCEAADVSLTAVGAGDLDLPEVRLDVRPWREDSEVEDIHRFDVGIMPLTDSPWERGKCGFKLIQYMACGKPVVASPVGANKTIVQEGINGFLAHAIDDWIRALLLLRADPALKRRLGAAGRRLVEEKYSLQKTTETVASTLRRAARSSGAVTG